MVTSNNTQDLTTEQVQELISGESYIIIGRGGESDSYKIEEEEASAWMEEYQQSDLTYRFTLEELVNEVRPEGCGANDEEGSSIYILSKESISQLKAVIRTKLKEFYVQEHDEFGVEHYKEAIQAKIEELGDEREAVEEVMNEEFDDNAVKLWHFGLEVPRNGANSVLPGAVEEFIEAMDDLGLSHLGSPGHEGFGAENRGWRLF